MNTKVSYRISSILPCATYVHEYWDDILIYKWRVAAIYRGGDILEFLERNDTFRMPNFEGLNEYHRRTFILDL